MSTDEHSNEADAPNKPKRRRRFRSRRKARREQEETNPDAAAKPPAKTQPEPRPAETSGQQDDPQQPEQRPRKKRRPQRKQLNGVFRSLKTELKKAVLDAGNPQPTPVQNQILPHLLEERDLFAVAPVESGGALSFVLPMLQLLAGENLLPLRGYPRALVLTPSDERAQMIGEQLATFGAHLDLVHCVLLSGTAQDEEANQIFNDGIDIVVATLNGLIEHIQADHLDVVEVDTVVVDQADVFEQEGSLATVQVVLDKLPLERWSMIYTNSETQAVIELAEKLLQDPVHISWAPIPTGVGEHVEQRLYFVDATNKDALLSQMLTKRPHDRLVIYTRMKVTARRLADQLNENNVTADAVDSERSIGDGNQAMARFADGETRVLVVTEAGVRGLRFDAKTPVQAVINYDIPTTGQRYIRRIGHVTADNQPSLAASFCCAREREFLRDVEQFLDQDLPVITDHEFHSQAAREAEGDAARPQRKRRARRRGGRSRSNRRDTEGDNRGPGE